MNIPDSFITITQYTSEETRSEIIAASVTIAADCAIPRETLVAYIGRDEMFTFRDRVVNALYDAIRSSPQEYLHEPGAQVVRIATPKDEPRT